jgi:release factor glutamine methyltransferase
MPDLDIVQRLRAAGCVFAEDEARILIETATNTDDLERMLQLRIEGLPLEQIVGWADFAGLRIIVEPGVFVPRRRTEFLFEHALELATRQIATGIQPVVVDLCCGTGALAAALASRLPDLELYASDIDPAEVHCARRNIRPPGEVFEGDLFQALPSELRWRVDILAVNAPYVPTDEIRLMPPEARLYEAPVALDGGVDGLDIQRRVADEAPNWLAPGGQLLIETSERQASLTAAALERAGLRTRVVHSEEYYATVVIGERRG